MDSQVLKNLAATQIIASVSQNVEADLEFSTIALLFDDVLFKRINFRQFVHKISAIFDLEEELFDFYDYQSFSTKEIADIYEMILEPISESEAKEIEFIFEEFDFFKRIEELNIFDQTQLKEIISFVNEGKTSYEEIFEQISAISFNKIEEKKEKLKEIDFGWQKASNFIAETDFIFALFNMKKLNERGIFSMLNEFHSSKIAHVKFMLIKLSKKEFESLDEKVKEKGLLAAKNTKKIRYDFALEASEALKLVNIDEKSVVNRQCQRSL